MKVEIVATGEECMIGIVESSNTAFTKHTSWKKIINSNDKSTRGQN